MLVYSFFSKYLHISADGKRTNCAKDCTEWHKQDSPTDWKGQKKDCRHCGDAFAFEQERAKLVEECNEQAKAAVRQRIERTRQWELRQVALANIVVRYTEMLASLGYTPEVSILPSGGQLVFTDTQNDLKFQVNLDITW